MKITDIQCHVMGVPGPDGKTPRRNWIFVEVFNTANWGPSGNTDTCTFDVTIIDIELDAPGMCYLGDGSSACVGITGKTCPPGGARSITIVVNQNQNVTPQSWTGAGTTIGQCNFSSGLHRFTNPSDTMIGIEFDIIVQYTLNGVTCEERITKTVPNAQCGGTCQ